MCLRSLPDVQGSAQTHKHAPHACASSQPATPACSQPRGAPHLDGSSGGAAARVPLLVGPPASGAEGPGELRPSSAVSAAEPTRGTGSTGCPMRPPSEVGGAAVEAAGGRQASAGWVVLFEHHTSISDHHATPSACHGQLAAVLRPGNPAPVKASEVGGTGGCGALLAAGGVGAPASGTAGTAASWAAARCAAVKGSSCAQG